jgi:hypothetical protein
MYRYTGAQAVKRKATTNMRSSWLEASFIGSLGSGMLRMPLVNGY